MTSLTQVHPANATGLAGAGKPVGIARLVTMLILPTAAMYATFQGLQQILIPAQMEALDPVNKISNLGLLTTLSEISAVGALPVGGAVSDRTRGRWGRRAPWLVATSIVSALLMVIMGRADALLPFALLYMLLWFAMNFYQGALTAVLPIAFRSSGEASRRLWSVSAYHLASCSASILQRGWPAPQAIS